MSRTEVSNTNLKQVPGNSIKGNSTTTSGYPSDIVIGTNQLVGNTGSGITNIPFTSVVNTSTVAAVLSAGPGIAINTSSNAIVLSSIPSDTIITTLNNLGLSAQNLLTVVNNLSAANNSSPSVAKAWVSFLGRSTNGTCTLNAQYNVSSVTRNGLGNYTVTYTKPLNTSSYVVVGNAAGATNISYASPVYSTTKSISSAGLSVPRMDGANAGNYDPTNGCDIVVFGY